MCPRLDRLRLDPEGFAVEEQLGLERELAHLLAARLAHTDFKDRGLLERLVELVERGSDLEDARGLLLHLQPPLEGGYVGPAHLQRKYAALLAGGDRELEVRHRVDPDVCLLRAELLLGCVLQHELDEVAECLAAPEQLVGADRFEGQRVQEHCFREHRFSGLLNLFVGLEVSHESVEPLVDVLKL